MEDNCICYLKSEWENQKTKIKELLGHNDAYSIEQYVNTLIFLAGLNVQIQKAKDAQQKNFEEWWDKNKHDLYTNDNNKDSIALVRVSKQIAEMAWMAARFGSYSVEERDLIKDVTNYIILERDCSHGDGFKEFVFEWSKDIVKKAKKLKELLGIK